MKDKSRLIYLFIFSTIQFMQVDGNVGDTCTGSELTNCTSSNTTGYSCINSICSCSDGFYKDSNNSCQQRHGYNESCMTSVEDSCNVTNGSCYNGFCKCNISFYTQNNQCKPVSDLQPTDFNKTTTTTTNITFTWTVSSSDKIKHFIITGTNLPSKPNIPNTMTTTTITSLTPGTTYNNIIITAVVTTDRGDVNVSSNIINQVTTKSGYNDNCQTTPDTCIEENTDCYSTTGTTDTIGTTGTCKCKENYYRNTVNNMCKNVSDLEPVNVNISDVTRTSFTISWTRKLPQFVSSYILTGEPDISKTVDNNTSSTPINNNIKPGTNYTNIMVTAVVTTDRGPVNVISTQTLDTLTRSHYNESCFISEDECDVINGGCYNGFCKCNNNFYTQNNQCKPVSDLQPTDFKPTTTTTTNITFTWTVSSSNKIKHFIITGTNLPSQPDIPNTMTTTTITSLTPGTTYNDIMITAVVSTDRGDVNISSNTISASTVPGKAGDLLSNNVYNTTQTMIIRFDAPTAGSVGYYIVNILNTSINKNTSINSIQLEQGTLLPGRVYTINITTVYSKKQGETSIQTFRTLSEGSSPVQNLSITGIKSRKFTVSWSYPADNKGNLTAYILDINDNNVCIKQYRYFYNLNNRINIKGVASCNYVSNISHDLKQPVNQEIMNLLPDTHYTVSVLPYNYLGLGQIREEKNKTLIEVAGEPTMFNIIELTATSVTFTWKKPVPRPGPTNYMLTVYEQSDPSDNNVSHIYLTKTITGYEVEEYRITSLKSTSYYRATIQAVTIAGTSSVVLLNKFQTKASSNIASEERQNSSSNNFLVPLVVSLVVVALLVAVGLLALFLYRRRKRNLLNPSIYENIKLGQTGGLEETFIPRYRPVKLCDLVDHIDNLENNSNQLFTREFQDIQQLCSKHPSSVASYKGNKSKNRNENVVPYDHCRVKIKDSTSLYENMKNNDYINASYIAGSVSQRDYIVTQNPMESTVIDFWRMVWEESVSLIVMLTSAEKFRYWKKDFNSPQSYGGVEVQLKNISDNGKGKIRTMDISLSQEKRTIKHISMSDGKDFLVNPKHAMTFIQLVKQEKASASDGQTLVHCSDGSGRTGAFIVLDILQEQIEEKDMSSEIDIFELVLKIQYYRKNCINTQDVYKFIYRVAKEMVEEKNCRHTNNYSTLYEIADTEHVYV